jgi:probable rRNA maturation factor
MTSEPYSGTKPVIDFFCEEIEFELDNRRSIVQWLQDCYKQENKVVAVLNYIFCSDDYLHRINMQYLNHDKLTDIITFSNAREGAAIRGDIFISIDRIKENAIVFDTSFDQELKRVIIHGSLHLMGYKDKTEEDKKLMTEKEDFYMACYPAK